MRWVLAETDQTAARRLADEAGLHPLIAALLVNRGILEHETAASFLACDLAGLSEPWIFSHMESAVSRIHRAVKAGEKIVVYGDYDADGVTAAAVLYLVLKELGADADYYIPDRLSEGYGLNLSALDSIKKSGAGLVVTVDCGISAFAEAEHAASIGLDLVITDHHQIVSSCPASSNEKTPDENRRAYALPSAHAILHPLLLNEGVNQIVRDRVAVLTGVGVAFKLAQALLDADAGDPRLMKYLDLVAVGTVADVGSITGENRILVKHGLDILSSVDLRPGLAALKQEAGIDGRPVGVGMVGFSLGPRLNASGRLENAYAALRLLTTLSQEEAVALAKQLDSLNRERQSVEDAIREEARAKCIDYDMERTGAFVLDSPDWHPGVVGIVASRIADEFYRPAALIAVRDGVGKGSARSIPGFDLYAGLLECRDILLNFGGHTYAAGFAVQEKKIPELRTRLNDIALERLGKTGFMKTLFIDCAVNLSDITTDLVRDIERLAPFGQGNPEPRLGARGLDVIDARVVGNNHLRLRLGSSDSATLTAIGFGKAGLLGKRLRIGSKIAAVFTPRVKTWNGLTSVELEIRDIKTEKW